MRFVLCFALSITVLHAAPDSVFDQASGVRVDSEAAALQSARQRMVEEGRRRAGLPPPAPSGIIPIPPPKPTDPPPEPQPIPAEPVVVAPPVADEPAPVIVPPKAAIAPPVVEAPKVAVAPPVIVAPKVAVAPPVIVAPKVVNEPAPVVVAPKVAVAPVVTAPQPAIAPVVAAPRLASPRVLGAPITAPPPPAVAPATVSAKPTEESPRRRHRAIREPARMARKEKPVKARVAHHVARLVEAESEEEPASEVKAVEKVAREPVASRPPASEPPTSEPPASEPPAPPVARERPAPPVPSEPPAPRMVMRERRIEPFGVIRRTVRWFEPVAAPVMPDAPPVRSAGPADAGLREAELRRRGGPAGERARMLARVRQLGSDVAQARVALGDSSKLDDAQAELVEAREALESDRLLAAQVSITRAQRLLTRALGGL